MPRSPKSATDGPFQAELNISQSPGPSRALGPKTLG